VIPVTRLDGTSIVVNIDLVQCVEPTPDTVLTLTTGERLMVRESVDEIVGRALAFKRQIAAGPVVGPRREEDAVE